MLIISTKLLQQLFHNIFLESLTKSSDMVNKNIGDHIDSVIRNVATMHAHEHAE